MTTESKPKVATETSMIVDNLSPPGAWKDEMSAAPWGYGQSQQTLVERSLQNIRRAGLSNEATVLSLELLTLRNELEYQMGKKVR
jgi:hypothetical protein